MKPIPLKVLWLVPCLLFLALDVPAQTWVEDTFEDFRDGKLDAAGQNIYVSRDGSIRTIHRFDLNQDGFIDLIFNSTHDTNAFIPATLAAVGAQRALTTGPLAVEGSIQSVAADLNHDGWPDLLFCPNASGVQHPRRLLTMIWGGPDGWPASRTNGLLPVYGAAGIAVADLNGDGWPDIVTLNQAAWMPGQPDGRIVRVYWGGEAGFMVTRYHDLGVPDASGLAQADFDGDGAGDAAVLRSDGKILFLWGKGADGDARPLPSGALATRPKEVPGIESSETEVPVRSAACLTAADLDGDRRPELLVGAESAISILKGAEKRRWLAGQEIKGLGATQIVPSDLDQDGFVDLAVTDFSISRAAGGEPGAAAGGGPEGVSLLWGGPRLFSTEESTRLDILNASSVAPGDLDGDGSKDLAVAVYQGAKSFAGSSLVFFGAGGRRFERSADTIPTQGAAHVAIVPAVGKISQAAVIFSNSQDGSLREEVPTLVYWGGPGGFDAQRRLEIPMRSGYETTCADFDADGFPDLVALDSMHAGQRSELDPWAGANIFRGSAKGFNPSGSRTVLREISLGTSNTADLDKDGYLDLVLGQFANGGQPTEVIIYYGSDKGFDVRNRRAVPSPGRSISSLIADFNGDDWLDIAVSSYDLNCVRVFWGGAAGFAGNRQWTIDVPGAIDLETADLNRDGRLDLIVCSYMDPVTGHHDTGALILWGGGGGFKHWNAQRLPAITPLAPVVADFDGDGGLDIFFPHYHDELHRELLPSYLYWGGPAGFAPRRRTALVNDSAADGLAADFDGDGKLDLAVVNHTVDGDHHALSKIFFNDGNRFANPRIQKLPTHGPHWMWDGDIGHIADRGFAQRYESSVFAWRRLAGGGTVEVDARLPGGAGLNREVRSAPAASGLATSAWRAVEGGRFRLDRGDRFLQYRLTLTSGNGDAYPVVDRVTVQLR
ncbi:MAG: hypothetical protein A2W03_17210 [Candidatus Aminicenantes bacterium RBG_16_63_16]|nr:MAG: hypothetical protein A2W03_17210 [Candidatus Aminicenantes bacterium RBG_16_63_16]